MPRSGHNAVVNWLVRQRGHDTDMFMEESPNLRGHGWAHDKNTFYVGADDVLNPKKRAMVTQFVGMDNGLVLVSNDETNPKLELDRYIIDELRKRCGDVQIVLIIRDFYNNLASLLKSKIHYLDAHKAKWIAHAKEVLGYTRMLGDCRTILYNRWFTSKGYRQVICRSLGYKFTDAGLNEVPFVGSTFDGCTYNGNAQQMDVLHRYKTCADNERYQELIRDEEIFKLNIELFE